MIIDSSVRHDEVMVSQVVCCYCRLDRKGNIGYFRFAGCEMQP